MLINLLSLPLKHSRFVHPSVDGYPSHLDSGLQASSRGTKETLEDLEFRHLETDAGSGLRTHSKRTSQ